MEGLKAPLIKAAAAGANTFASFLLSELQPPGGANASKQIFELLQTLTVDQINTLWNAVDGLVDATLDRHFYREGEEAEAAAPEADDGSHIILLQRLVALLFAWVEDPKQELDNVYWTSVQRLHAVMLHIPDDKEGRALRTAISKLNERLWAQKRSERNTVAPLTIAVLLVDAHEEGAGDAVVKRIWAFRECLALFDWSEPDNDSLRELLLHCFRRPLFTRSADNRRVLASIMAQCGPLVPEAHAVIKSHLLAMTGASGSSGAITAANARALEGWGEVYYRAWSAAEGSARLEVEQAAIQDLMSRATYAAQPGTFAALRRVLGVLVAKKAARAKGVEAMLLRLYSPILFRALGAANPAVRKNAALLLLDAFPLRATELEEAGNQAGSDATLEAQFTALTSLLLDACPSVREVGVAGVCRVLGSYWELIPPAVSKTLLARLIDDCAHDATSPIVRAAVPAALSELIMAQPLSHPMLAQAAMLPSLADLLNDRSEKVRVAMACLLSTLTSVRTLSLWDIILVESVLARLAMDQGLQAVAEPLSKVLVRSYFPEGCSNNDLMKRLLMGLKDHEASTYAFLSWAYRSVPLTSLVKYTLLTQRVLQSSLRSHGSSSAAAVAGAQAQQVSESAADADAEDNGATEEKTEEADEDAGFARKGGKKGAKAGKKGAATVAASAAGPMKVKRDRAGNAKTTAAGGADSSAATASSSNSSGASVSLRTIAALSRCLAILCRTVIPLLQQQQQQQQYQSQAKQGKGKGENKAAVGSAKTAAAKGSKAGKGGKGGSKGKKGEDTSEEDTADVDADDEGADDVDPLTGARLPNHVTDEHAEARKQLFASLGGDAIPSMLEAVTSAVPVPARGARAPGASPTNASSGVSDVGADGADVARSAITSSLLSMAGLLPPSVLGAAGQERLVSSLWSRLLHSPSSSSFASPSSPAASNDVSGGSSGSLAPLLACLTSWGMAGKAVEAATASISAAAASVQRGASIHLAEDSSAGASGEGSTMHPLIALSVLQAVMAMTAAPGAGVAIEAPAVEAAMAALSDGMHCTQQQLLTSSEADATQSAEAAEFAVSCARAWCALLLQSVHITAEVAGHSAAGSLAGGALTSQGRWAGEGLLRACVVAEDAAQKRARRQNGSDSERLEVPLAAARCILSLLIRLACDLVGLGYGCDAAVGLLTSLTSDMAVSDTSTSDISTGGGEEGATTSLTPLDWSCGAAAASSAATGAASSAGGVAASAADEVGAHEDDNDDDDGEADEGLRAQAKAKKGKGKKKNGTAAAEDVAVSSSSSSASSSSSLLHQQQKEGLAACVVRLGLRLHAVACGNVVTSVDPSTPPHSGVTASSSPSSLQQPVVLPGGSRLRVWRALTRALLAMGAPPPSSSASPAVASSSPLAPFLRAAWSAALEECSDVSGAALLTASSGGYTADFLSSVLGEVDQWIPDNCAAVVALKGPALDAAAEGEGDASEAADQSMTSEAAGSEEKKQKLRPESLGNAAVAALVAVCAGLVQTSSSGSRRSARSRKSSSGSGGEMGSANTSAVSVAMAQALSCRWTTLQGAYASTSSASASAAGGAKSHPATLPFRALATVFSTCVPPGSAASRQVAATLEAVLS